MKKILVFLLVMIITPIIGGIYGALHDQLTYTISHEYYTKFKFIQFGFVDFDYGREVTLPNPRLNVAMVGFLATWWTGLFIGPAFALTGLIYKDYRIMFKKIFNAILIALIVTLITGLIGLAYGKFYLVNHFPDWWFPENLIDRENFMIVGSMHNFSYLGGLLGLIAGIIYIIFPFLSPKRKKLTKVSNMQSANSQ